MAKKPRPIPELDDAAQIGVGVGTVCVRRSTGVVTCFGH
jgi:hypothetical protein